MLCWIRSVVKNYCPPVFLYLNCTQIEELCQDVELAHDLGVPSKLTNYHAYIDLVLLR